MRSGKVSPRPPGERQGVRVIHIAGVLIEIFSSPFEHHVFALFLAVFEARMKPG